MGYIYKKPIDEFGRRWLDHYLSQAMKKISASLRQGYM